MVTALPGSGEERRGDNLIHDHYLSHGWSEAQASQENASLTPDYQNFIKGFISTKTKTTEAAGTRTKLSILSFD